MQINFSPYCNIRVEISGWHKLALAGFQPVGFGNLFLFITICQRHQAKTARAETLHVIETLKKMRVNPLNSDVVKLVPC